MALATEIEKADRFVLRERVDVRLAYPQENGARERYESARLLDISHQGARLRAASAPTCNRLRVEWQLPELELSFFASASVCWQRSDTNGFQVGCAFRPAIPEAVFGRILASIETERRQTPRRFTNGVMQLASGWRKHRVKLVNYSPGGFCLHAKRELVPAARCRIVLDGFRFCGTIQWAVADGDGFLAGCAFEDEGDFNRLDELASS